MRNNISFVCACVFIFSFTGTASFATERPVTVNLNNQEIKFDQAPIIVNVLTLVPFRGFLRH